MLSIENLHVSVDEDKPILKGLSLSVPAGEVHAVMGPNGAGKSTLSYTIAGRGGYEVTSGSITMDGKDLLAMSPDARAAWGVFLSFQYPLEIPGVPALTFVRTALNAQRKTRGQPEMGAREFLKRVRAEAAPAEDGLRHAAPGAERRLLRRREEAHGDFADGAA